MTGPTSPAPGRRAVSAPARPRTVALMGIDGAGKTTQTRLLARHLAADGIQAHHLTNEVGATVREALDGYARERGHPDHASLAGDTAAHLAWAVTKATGLLAAANLLEGRADAVLVADRYTYCHYATERLTGGGGEALLRALHRHIPEPDLAVFIDADPGTAARRTEERGHGVETVETLRAYRDAYREMPEFAGFTVIDGDAPPEVVHRAVVDLVAKEFDLPATAGPRASAARPCGCR
ncbi:dTMP kinase [Streptomyces griseoaurantiacus]|uniref:dTMP kinase n=1 Tax=Streptomyces griseoaurantiacus TaxID=68213 RepID=UPI00345F3BCD